MTFPIAYIAHGGGPLPLLNDPHHASLSQSLTQLGQRLGQPDAILCISAHWEERVPTVSSSPSPAMLYDYSGFPSAAYELDYPAPGEPALAKRVTQLLEKQQIAARQDQQRGFDHGTFVPLMLMYPEANIPVVQLSLATHFDPAAHIATGKAIAELSLENILILGSGFSFHNMQFSPATDAKAVAKSQAFDAWLNQTVLESPGKLDQEQALINWQQAPHARFSHPREEHLLPLHVCFGAASARPHKVENIFDESMYGAKISAFLWT